jgi:hypothetical protein
LLLNSYFFFRRGPRVRFVISILFLVLSTPTAFGAAEPCETLLEAKSVQNTVQNLLDGKMSRWITIGLKGQFGSMSYAEETALRHVLANPLGRHMAKVRLQDIANENGSFVAVIFIEGRGKDILRSLIDLNARPEIKRGVWTAWKVTVQDQVDSQLGAPLPAPASLSAEETRRVFSIPINSMDFSTRTARCLRNENIFFVGDLVRRTPNELLGVQTFGHRSLKEVEDRLGDLGLSLAMRGQWSAEAISPALRQVATQWTAQIELSDWIATNDVDAEILMDTLSKYAFSISENGEKILMIWNMDMFSESSDLNLARYVSEKKPLETTAAQVHLLRRKVRTAPVITLQQTFGESGRELLRHAAETEMPLRIQIWPDRTECLIALPVIGED